MKVELSVRNDGKVSLTLDKHMDCVLRVLDPHAAPYPHGTQRARAWAVVSLMDGLSVQQADSILKILEPNIQGQAGRSLGWIVDAVDLGLVEIHKSV